MGEPRFGPEVEEYLAKAVEMYAVDDADLIFLVLPESLTSPQIIHNISLQLADEFERRGKTDRMLVVLPYGIVPYGVAPLNPLRRVEEPEPVKWG